MGKKVYIVFEETGEQGGKEFAVYMEGITEKMKTIKDPVQQTNLLSPAEFWGLRMFQHVTEILAEVGVVQKIKER